MDRQEVRWTMNLMVSHTVVADCSNFSLDFALPHWQHCTSKIQKSAFLSKCCYSCLDFLPLHSLKQRNLIVPMTVAVKVNKTAVKKQITSTE